MGDPPRTTATPVPPMPKKRSPQIAQLKRTFYFLSRNTLALIGLGIIVFFAVVALYSFFVPTSNTEMPLYCSVPYGSPPTIGCQPVCTYDPSLGPQPAPNCYPVTGSFTADIAPTVNFQHLNGGPLPLGSLEVGGGAGNYFYSIYDGLLKGAQWSLGISVAIVLTGAGIGLLLGAVAGYRGGYTDEVIMRFTDIFLSIPAILLVLVIIASLSQIVQSFDGRIYLLIGAFIITWWPFYTRIVRGQVLVTREQKFVEASRASGAKTPRILFKHIIPNSMYPVFVQLSLDVGAIPLLLGGLVYLGFRIFPTEYFPEWGSISAVSVIDIPSAIQTCEIGPCVFPWWQLLFPGLTVFLFAISVNFLSDGLRDALDPRLRR